VLAKNDRLDARLIAEYVAIMPPLDGKPVQQLEHPVPENGGIRKIVHEFVQWPPGQNLTIDNELPADDSEPVLVWHDVRHGNGKDGD
jgi:hypothetical protein